MNIYQIYFSPTGNTEKAVKIVGKVFGECKSIDLSERNTAAGRSFSKEDVCIFGVPSYGGRVPATALERMKQYEGNGARAVLLTSYGNRAFEDTLKELQDFLTGKGFLCIAGISAVAEHSIMRQFATGRPDAEDVQELTRFARKILDKLNQRSLPASLSIPGNTPYREYNGVPLKPKAGKDCKGCGTCAALCPVGAIPTETPDKTNTDSCISCMRCVKICPSHARKVNSLMLKAASCKLKEPCREPKKNELWL